MATPLHQKLRIKENDTLLTLNAPADFRQNLGALPGGVSITETGKTYNQVHWFIRNKAQLEKELSKVLRLVKENTILWMYYPKGSSKLQTDLTRDKGWDSLMAHGDRLTWISLISFDETWSVFGCRTKTEADKKKDVKPQPAREISNYADAATKTVKLPDDLAAALKKDKKATDFFNQLSFTNKKEYVEWIITAKREETRTERVKGTLERLGKGWKNPSNR